MDLRIKIAKPGEDLACEYTGEQCRVLVKLANDTNESAWLGQQALQQALATLVSLNGGVLAAPSVQTPAPRWAPGPISVVPLQEQQGEPAPVAGMKSGTVSARDKEWLAPFHTDCVRIAQNPAPNAKGENTGVSELEIREIIALWKPRFQDPRCMLATLNKVFGMSKERFDTLIEFC